MAQSSCSIPTRTKTIPSAEEFQRKLHRWFEEQGLLSDLRAHMRQMIIAALKGTQLSPQAGHNMHQNTSPKIQAINLLVAEFLLLQECHYTLSVFTSEVPLLRNLPEFSPSFKDAAKNKLTTKKSGEVHDSPSRLQERHVWDILEALGFSLDSSTGKAVFKSYQESNGEPLLTCLIRSISKVIRHERKNGTLSMQIEENISVPDSDSSLSIAENADMENDKNDKRISSIHEILQKLNVKPKYMKILENEIKRLIKTTQLAEQENFHEKLLSYEKRVQEERVHYEKELYSQIILAQQQLVGQGATKTTGTSSLETQIMAAIEKLQHNLRLVEERDRRKEEEQLRQKMKKKELPEGNKNVLDNRQEEISHRAKSKKSAEKVATVPSVQQVDNQHDTGQILEEKSSCITEGDTNEDKGHITMTSSKSQQESSISSRDQSVQVGKPGWQVINEFEEVRATVQRLQQENEELRNLMREQQVQVTELRTWGQLHLAPSVSRSPAQTHLVDPVHSSPSVPSLPHPPPPPPPPLPPRVRQQRAFYHAADDELHYHATGATCVAPASTQTPSTGRNRTRRLRRFSTPRRVVLSSEGTSPTEEMLRDARHRLRQLEEESEAVDRSYRKFCLRQRRATPVADVLAELLQSTVRTECPFNNGPNASDATCDPSGFKLLRSFPMGARNFSSESLVTGVGRTEAAVSSITSQTQNTSVSRITRPIVTQNSNVCLSDLIYNIPSSEIFSQHSVSIHDQSTSGAVAETHTDSYQTAKMQAQSELHTTHFYKTPLLSSMIGNTSTNVPNCNNSVIMENFDSGSVYNKHKNESLNSSKINSTNESMVVPKRNNVCFERYALVAETVNGSDPSAMKKEQNKTAPSAHHTKTTAETVNPAARGAETPGLLTPLDKTIKVLKVSRNPEKESATQRIALADENVSTKQYEQNPLKTFVQTDSTQTTEKKSEGNMNILYQTTNENNSIQQMKFQASPEHSLKGRELSNPRLSDIISLQESSEELQDEKAVNHQEKETKKDLILHNIHDTACERLSLGDMEFIPASSGDQLFQPICETDTETEPGTSKSDMLPINDDQSHPNYKIEEQAVSNASISSEQPISAGRSVSSDANDFW